VEWEYGDGGSAYMEIQWVEMVYNVSGKASKRDEEALRSGGLEKRAREGCLIVCGIDAVTNVGVPEVVPNFTSGAVMGRRGGRIVKAGLPLKWWVMLISTVISVGNT
jgi:hypothetical protein